MECRDAPLAANGLELSCERTDKLLRRIESVDRILPETPDVQTIWRDFVRVYKVRGRKVYDTRLVAFMMAYGISDILTFNVGDFARYPGILAIDPCDVV